MDKEKYELMIQKESKTYFTNNKKAKDKVLSFFKKSKEKWNEFIKGFNNKLTDQFIKYRNQAKEYLDDDEKLDHLLMRVSKKLKYIPFAGKDLAYVPVLVALVKDYGKKNYREVPIGSLLSIVGGLIYLVTPIDVIPDVIPVIGMSDDAIVLGVVWNIVKDDVIEYNEWRHTQGLKEFDIKK